MDCGKGGACVSPSSAASFLTHRSGGLCAPLNVARLVRAPSIECGSVYMVQTNMFLAIGRPLRGGGGEEEPSLTHGLCQNWLLWGFLYLPVKRGAALLRCAGHGAGKGAKKAAPMVKEMESISHEGR